MAKKVQTKNKTATQKTAAQKAAVLPQSPAIDQPGVLASAQSKISFGLSESVLTGAPLSLAEIDALADKLVMDTKILCDMGKVGSEINTQSSMKIDNETHTIVGTSMSNALVIAEGFGDIVNFALAKGVPPEGVKKDALGEFLKGLVVKQGGDKLHFSKIKGTFRRTKSVATKTTTLTYTVKFGEVEGDEQIRARLIAILILNAVSIKTE